MIRREAHTPLSQQDRERYRLVAKEPDGLDVLLAGSPKGVPANPLDREFLMDMARTRVTAQTRQDLAPCVDRYLEKDDQIVARNKEALMLLGERLPLPPADEDYVERNRATPGEYGQRELNS